MSFKFRALTLAVATISSISAHAAGLDRSGQDVSAFLQDGTYAEAVYTYIDADVSGHDNAIRSGAGTTYTKGNATGDMAETYDFFRYGVKTDLNDSISIGVLYDEPFGAAVQHENGTNSNFVTHTTGEQAIQGALNRTLAGIQEQAKQDATLAAILSTPTGQSLVSTVQNVKTIEQAQGLQQLLAAQTLPATTKQQLNTALNNAINYAQDIGTKTNQGTNVEIRAHNVAALVGVKLGKNKQFQVYGGPQAQNLTGEVHLRGTAYQAATGYDAVISPDTAFGWVAGVAYSKPEIALKASLTYRSEMEHETTISENFPARNMLGKEAHTTKPFTVTLPESYNLDFQTGLSAKHRLLGTAKVRYVPWSDFTIEPPTYKETTGGLAIASYSKDQWGVELGLAKQVNDKLAVSGNVGWDSGAGNPVTTLGPIEGYYSVGLGAKYNITPEWALSAGAKYLKFGDATAQLPNKLIAGEFDDNDGYIVGVKLSYQKK